MIYLTDSERLKLRELAAQNGFNGKGAIERLVEKIINVPIIFLDSNSQKLVVLFAKIIEKQEQQKL